MVRLETSPSRPRLHRGGLATQSLRVIVDNQDTDRSTCLIASWSADVVSNTMSIAKSSSSAI